MAYYDYNLNLIADDVVDAQSNIVQKAIDDPAVQTLMAAGKRFKMHFVTSHGDCMQLSPAEETARDAADLAANLAALPGQIKAEGLSRVNALFPAITDLDQIDFFGEFWLSIAPAARQPTVDFQKIIDIRAAAKAAIVNVKTFTTQAQIDAYDPTTDPGWPA